MELAAVAVLMMSTVCFLVKIPWIAILVRRLRPWVIPVTLVFWIALRTSSLQPEASCLELLVHYIQQGRQYILSLLDESSLEEIRIWLPVCRWLFKLVEDLLAAVLVCQVLRCLYCFCHFTTTEWKDKVLNDAFLWASSNLSPVQTLIEKETAPFMTTAEQMLQKDPSRILTLQLPTRGRSAQSIQQELDEFAKKENQTWQKGQVSGAVYGGEIQHTELMAKVYQAYVWSNPLHPGLWPKVNQCEAEVIAMTADMLHAPESFGSLTSGGTESIILAVRAHLNFYGKKRSIQYPEIICGTSAHASLRKACDMFGIRLVSLDVNDYKHNYTLRPSQVKNFITSNTIMIFASAPGFPQGCVDPIPALSQLALDYDIGLHVDACLGGFVLPFCADAPLFDFRNKGVTSMSADTHKYGYASKGTSVVLYRSRELRRSQYFAYPHWTGGMYVTPTLAGSRAGALAACAWASMVSIGKEGYQSRVEEIVQAARKIAEGVQSIKGLTLLTAQPVFMVVCFGWEAEDEIGGIYRVQDAMESKGWSLNSLQAPASVHVCVTLQMVPHVDRFLKDLEESVEKASSEGKEGLTKGSAGVYGAGKKISFVSCVRKIRRSVSHHFTLLSNQVGKFPDGPVEYILQAFTDMTLTP